MKTTTKIAALIIAGAFAATPALAAKKKAAPKGPHEMTTEEAMAYNERNLSLVVQALPLVLPSWSLPVYFGLQQDQDKPTKHGKKKH